MGVNEYHFRVCSAANQVICGKGSADSSTDDRDGFIRFHDLTVVPTKRIENFQIVIPYKER